MKLLSEPLLHFLLAGAGLFATYTWLNTSETMQSANPQYEIRIGEGEVRWAAETWARQWQRDPSPEELRALVLDLVKEEMLEREARELGLDQDDTVVRRRLAQKMTFLIEDTSRPAEPTAEDLQRFYNAHLREFRREARVTFTQVFFNRDRATAEADAREALLELASASDAKLVADKGDQLLIPPEVTNADETSVSAQFGPKFARAVFALVPNGWQGPIESAYGLHLVRVSDVRPAEPLPFAEVRDKVLEGWREEQQREAGKRYFAGLFKKYRIVSDEGVKGLAGSLDAETRRTR